MSKKRWELSSAIAFLEGRGVEIKGKDIFVTKTLGSLRAGGALDYLKNHCGYKVFVGSFKN
jgi:hypothetical protein